MSEAGRTQTIQLVDGLVSSDEEGSDDLNEGGDEETEGRVPRVGLGASYLSHAQSLQFASNMKRMMRKTASDDVEGDDDSRKRKNHGSGSKKHAEQGEYDGPDVSKVTRRIQPQKRKLKKIVDSGGKKKRRKKRKKAKERGEEEPEKNL